MAEAEDKEKAEKVAAARKKYEQLKKQKAKKEAASGNAEQKKTASAKGKEDTKIDSTNADASIDADTDSRELAAGAKADEQPNEPATHEGEDEQNPDEDTSAHGRQPSLSLQSKMRSESFRKSGPASAGVEGNSPRTPMKSSYFPPLAGEHEEVQEIYRKQLARIEQLEKDQKKLEREVVAKSTSLDQAESELEELRSGNAKLADLQGKAGRADSNQEENEKLRSEITSLQRQNTQLQAHRRRSSITSPTSSTANEELHNQVSAKQSTIESLELELSNLRHALSTSETRASDLESKLSTSKSESEAAEKRLAHLKASVEASSNLKSSESDALEAAKQAETRLALLTSDLSAAQTSAANATSRADSLEKKIEALTKLHRDNDSRSQAHSKARQQELEKLRAEAVDLRRRLTTLTTENARLNDRRVVGVNGRKSVDGDGGGIEDLEDEELNRLNTRIRQLEGENFDLRRGVWRDRRKELQPDGDEDQPVLSPGSFDDIDLNGPSTSSPGSLGRSASSGYRAATDAFTNVWSAFTGGGSQGQHPSPHSRSAPFESVQDDEDEDGDDFGFDEAAFKAAKEAEAKARLERVREVKRSLPGWRGFRVDLVDVRGGTMAGVFDV